MKKIKYILIIVFFFTLSSCEKYTEGINDNPNAFVVSPSELLIGQVELSYMVHFASNNARYTSVFTNQFSGGDRQYLTLNTYSPNRANYNDMWQDAYIAGINNANIISSNESASSLLRGVAQILSGGLFADLALLYGNIPFSEAVQPNEFSLPVYDSQSTALQGAIDRISLGISNVGDATIAAGFGGNRMNGSTWKEAGNTLNARYSLSMGNYAQAITYAQSGISARANDFVSLHGTSNENRNLYYQFIITERQDYLIATDSHLVNLLNGTAERSLATPANDLVYNHYFIDDSESSNVLINTNDTGIFAQSNSFALASYYENQLILAEAQYQMGNQDMARQHLNNVRAELRVQFDSDAAGFPDSTASGDLLLRQILEEKYIVLPGQIVTFHDLRRTRNYIQVPNKTEGSTAPNGFPQRFLYPQVELDTNPNIPSPLPTFFEPTELLGGTY